MTAIAAAFSAGGRGPEGAVRRMLDAAAHRGAHAPQTWSAGPVALGCRASVRRDGTAQAAFAATPDGCAIVFDGRLDNRDEVGRALSCAPCPPDPELALAAYAAWGNDTPAALLGDFAFALWDAPNGRLFCARDPFGQRPLFYAHHGGATAIGSEPQQVLAHPGVPRVVNEGAIAEYLTGAPASISDTLWSGVIRLPPAHALVVSGSGARAVRYWDFDPEARLEYRDEREYAEHFRALFRQAIECRTRGAASVGVFLSGGLDSSAIAGAAEAHVRGGGGAPVRAFSVTFPGLSMDETPYIDAVVQKWRLPSLRLAARAATLREMTQQIAQYDEVPTYPHGAVLDPLRRRAAPEVDVLLTGYGGDDWFTGSVLHTADLLRAGRLVAAAVQFDHDVRRRGYPRAGLLRAVIAPLLPPAGRAMLRPLFGTRPPAYPWIRPEFAARVGLHERLRPPVAVRSRTLVQTQMRAVANSAQQVIGDELEDRAAAAAGLDQRHPFNDRRLAEFGFALPESQRWAGGVTKVVMRRAVGDLLPDLVRARTDKAEFTPTFVQAIEALGGRACFGSLRSAEAGWVDAAAVRRIYQEMSALYSRGDQSYIPMADALWSVAALELWLHHR